MRPAPHAATTVRAARAGRAARGGRRGAWLRVLVLLLALVLPCAHATAQAAPLTPVAGASGTGVGGGEYDHLDTAPRAPARSVRRGAVLRALSPGRMAGPRERRPVAPPVPAGPPSSPRSVVLRC
ncbi:hypothetical protein [Streptomyces mutabilis]|uniref:hypothetical protein n=1 Tax=Streptomyces mutabilis TaxID=67332 RepID=UPI0034201156